VIESFKKKAVGVLSTSDSPILPFILEEMIRKDFLNIKVFLDKKGFGEENKNIFDQRTAKFFSKKGFTLEDIDSRKITYYFVNSHNDESCLNIIKSLDISVLINAGTPRKLEGKIINSTPFGAVNIHPGILPQYRGSCCVEWSIFNNDQIGNTAHFMDLEYDQGQTIFIEEYNFPSNVTYEGIRTHMYK